MVKVIEEIKEGIIIDNLASCKKEVLINQYNKDFVEEGLNRTLSGSGVPGKVKIMYRRLCQAANYAGE